MQFGDKNEYEKLSLQWIETIHTKFMVYFLCGNEHARTHCLTTVTIYLYIIIGDL